MAITLVQSVTASSNNTTGTTTLTLGATPTAGNLLVLALSVRSDYTPDTQSISPSGWTQIAIATRVLGNGGSCSLWYKVAGPSEATSHTITSKVDYKRGVLAEFHVDNPIVEVVSATAGGAGPPFPIDVDMSAAGLGVAIHIHTDPDNGTAWTDDASWTTLTNGNALGFDPKQITSYRVVSSSGNVTHTPTAGSLSGHAAVMAGFVYGDIATEDHEPPEYEPPPPGGAILEIYTSEPGSARWDSALWGVDTWAVAGWQDITPEGIDVEILWGSQRPELGILSKPDPASWAIDLYDPDRTLDPANDESPYFGDLLPGLPVRLSHNGTVVRQGVMEGLSYQHSKTTGEQDTAYMRVTDILSVLGNAQVPSDSTLSDTLYARARDAISAAGVTVTVLPDPVGGDPALAAWVTGQEASALEWIMDAAESVLCIPYVTNVGHLGFRPWATPLDRGRVIASPNLVGLQTIVEHNGVYSVVSALNDPDTGVYTTRELTPKPRYGARTYVRDRVTPAPGDWALAVLRDRAVPGLRYVPGEVYPLTAADVTDFASIEAVENVSIVYLEADPAIIEEAIVVGGRVTVTGKKDSEAVWAFTFEAAQTAPSPLVTEDLLDLLMRDDDPTEFLYPDG